MTLPVSLKKFVDEMDSQMDEWQVFIHRSTGEFLGLSLEEMSAAERDAPLSQYPEWQRELIRQAHRVIETDEFLALPSKFDIHEWSIMKRFCDLLEDEDVRDDLLFRIRGRGAFRSFKDGVYRHGIADDWYRFRQEALEKFAIDWLDEHGFPYTRQE